MYSGRIMKQAIFQISWKGYACSEQGTGVLPVGAKGGDWCVVIVMLTMSSNLVQLK